MLKHSQIDREWDRRLRIDTAGLDAREADADRARYEPTPYAVLERLAESGWIGRDDRVLDYGCGKGRAVLFLAARLGCRATGVDFSEKLIADAEANRRRCPARERAAFVCCPAERYAVRDENAFFFFNPFSEKVLRVVLQRLRRSWYAAPRTMRLYCYYPSDEFAACL